MRKFIQKGLFYLIGILTVAWVLARLGYFVIGNSSFYKPSYVASGLDNDRFDMIIAGSSRGLSALSAGQIQNETGKKVLNLCMTDTALPTHFLMIQHFFESGNHADVVVLSLDLADMESSEVKIGDADFKFLPFSGEKYVQDFYEVYDQSELGSLKNSGLVPFMAFSEYNSQLIYPSLRGLINPDFTYLFDKNGDYSYPDYLARESTGELEDIELDLSNPILEQIQEYVEAEGSRLVVYIAPYLSLRIDPGEKVGLNLINHSGLLELPRFFADEVHLVNSGKKGATSAFLEALDGVLSE